MLINNGIRQGGGPMRTMGGASGASVELGKWSTPGSLRNFYAGEATVIGGVSIADKNSFPAGYMFPYTWVAAPKAGGLASRNKANGTGTLTVDIKMGVATTGTASGAGSLTGDLVLTVPVAGTAAGVGTLTGDLIGVAPLSGTITGAGAATGDIGAIAGLSGAAAGVGTLAVTVGAFPAELSGSIIVTYTATIDADDFVARVWNYLLEGDFSAGDLQRIMSAVIAGPSSGGPVTPIYRDLFDTVDRVAGVANIDGDRYDIVYDPQQ
jgi:hypothetical protein